MADDQRRLRATTMARMIQDCSMAVQFAFKRKSNEPFKPAAGPEDYERLLDALGHDDRTNLQFYEQEIGRLNSALVNWGDKPMGVIYALPLLDTDRKAIGHSFLMRQQERGPSILATIGEWFGGKAAEAAGDKLTEILLYWIRNDPVYTISHIEIRGSYPDETQPEGNKRVRYSDVIIIPFENVNLLSFDSAGNRLIDFLLRASDQVDACRSFGQMLAEHGECFEALQPLDFGISDAT
jgi:hypothetical protein